MKEDTSKITNLTKVEKVEMRGIIKQFPGVLANNRIDFDVRAGEVHTLLGENGAGKSTLMKILYGIYHQDKFTLTKNWLTFALRWMQFDWGLGWYISILCLSLPLP